LEEEEDIVHNNSNHFMVPFHFVFSFLYFLQILIDLLKIQNEILIVLSN